MNFISLKRQNNFYSLEPNLGQQEVYDKGKKNCILTTTHHLRRDNSLIEKMHGFLKKSN